MLFEQEKSCPYLRWTVFESFALRRLDCRLRRRDMLTSNPHHDQLVITPARPQWTSHTCRRRMRQSEQRRKRRTRRSASRINGAADDHGVQGEDKTRRNVVTAPLIWRLVSTERIRIVGLLYDPEQTTC